MTRFAHGAFGSAFLPLLLALPAPLRAQGEPLDPSATAPLLASDFGPLRGTRIEGAPALRCWKAIPFAAPPLGALRWQPPRDPRPWTEPRDAWSFGAICPQPSLGAFSRGLANESEDCLTLNVWAPERAEGAPLLPVLVWIHGGGLVIGGASAPYYDAAVLARSGAVVISIQYRLGPLGFFAHPALVAEGGASVANLGLLDQIHALRWVQRHAERLGGDPQRVTIFGESAGALSVSCLLVSPLAKDLFQRAILQSGTATGAQLPTLDDAQRAARALATEELGVAKDATVLEAVAALRAIEAERLIEILRPGIDPQRGTRWRAIVDGAVLPDQPQALFARGAFHRVPILIGANSGDGSVFAPLWPVKGALSWKLALRGLLGAERAPQVLALYPWDAADPTGTVERLLTDQAFVAPARRLARDVARAGGAAWLYHFDYVSSAPAAQRTTAAHGAEIPLLFGLEPLGRASERDRAVGAALREHWLRFAATGAPVAEAPSWPRIDADLAQPARAMYFRAEPRLGEAPARAACDLWDAIGFVERER
ncbi:MAG: carboxylesterase family protein [Planctomycetes bacterium]|nr:carboxylesterase family protein [Planctomycetota bacterium]